MVWYTSYCHSTCQNSPKWEYVKHLVVQELNASPMVPLSSSCINPGYDNGFCPVMQLLKEVLQMAVLSVVIGSH